jgi:hypothetical protein
MFIEAARWADDAKGSMHDRPTWHTARWPIVAKDAPPEAKVAVEACHRGLGANLCHAFRF